MPTVTGAPSFDGDWPAPGQHSAGASEAGRGMEIELRGAAGPG